jgi:hypothetical protein
VKVTEFGSMSACKVTETSSLKSSSAPPTDKLRHGRPSAGPQWRWRITSYAITRRTGHSDPPALASQPKVHERTPRAIWSAS